MTHPAPDDAIHALELIEGDMLCIEDFARLCSVSTDWVLARLQDEILTATWRDETCFFSSATLWRARQMVAIERQFDADPALAALVTDMIEEIRRLRDRVAYYESGQG